MSSMIRQETAVFFSSVLHGILLALAYDILRALRRAFAHNLAAVSAEDFFYWMLAGFLTFGLIFLKTDGVIRGYVVVGIGIGALLYHNSCSALILKALTAFWKLIQSILNGCLVCRHEKKGDWNGWKEKASKQEQPPRNVRDCGDCPGTADRSAGTEPGPGKFKQTKRSEKSRAGTAD